jgi:AraC-like DNA-binding protein
MFASQVSAPPPSLAAFVEAIWQVDVSDRALVEDLSVVVLPSAAPVLVVHFRAPVASDRRRPFKSIVAGVQSATERLRPMGATGLMVVRFRPDQAARVLGPQMHAFAGTSVDLADIVGPPALALLENELAEAASPADRVGVMERFLLTRLGDRVPDHDVRHALRQLQRRPATRIGAIARDLGISERHLTRSFVATVGVPPKQFARVVRAERVIAARLCGSAADSSWAQIALDCGFSDQAHLVHDFKALAGAAPEAFLRGAMRGPHAERNRALKTSGFYNTFLV